MLKEITERFSVRNFRDEQIPDEALKEILEAARFAPSWMNTQPWHFIVVKNETNKALLSQLAHGQQHVKNVPVIILCCGDKSVWNAENFRKNLESKPGITPERIELLLGNEAFNPVLRGKETVTARTLEGLTSAISYMTLEAHAQGLGCTVIGAIGNNLTGSVPEVYNLAKRTFNLPPDIEIMAMLILGYPSDDIRKPEKRRKAFEEVVSYDIYGG